MAITRRVNSYCLRSRTISKIGPYKRKSRSPKSSSDGSGGRSAARHLQSAADDSVRLYDSSSPKSYKGSGESLVSKKTFAPPQSAFPAATAPRKPNGIQMLGGLAPPVKSDPKGYLNQCRECAQLALKHYNSKFCKGGVAYKLVDPGESSGFVHWKQGFIFHCNFLAKPRKPDSPDSPNMLFFAETCDSTGRKPRVLNCCVLGPAGTVSLGLSGCRACKVSHHPPKGFNFGTKESFRCP